MPHWCDQKSISLPRTWACHTLFWESHAFFLHESHQWAARAQPHVKRPDSPGRGWLIVPQSLSSSPDKETLDYSPGSKCWTHTLPSRERECPETFAGHVLHTTQQFHCQDFVVCLWQPTTTFTFILSWVSWYKTTAKRAGLRWGQNKCKSTLHFFKPQLVCLHR